jgi:hypothetical protein
LADDTVLLTESGGSVLVLTHTLNLNRRWDGPPL